MNDLQKYNVFALELKELFDKYMLIPLSEIELKSNTDFFRVKIDDDSIVLSNDEKSFLIDYEELPRVSFDESIDYDENDGFDPFDL